MIYITGDTHREFKRLGAKAWFAGRKLSKADYVIVCGDFGLLWEGFKSDEELYWTNWLNEKPWTTLWVCGNHENHLRIKQLLDVDMFGGTVGKVSDSIYHLRRGQMYNIPDRIDGTNLVINRKIFTFGGAASIDKHLRKEHVSWWAQEIPSYQEMDFGLETLEKNNNEVDIVITHTMPSNVYPSLGIVGPRFDIKDPTENYLEEVRKRITFKKWFFGHWHFDRAMIFEKQQFHALYEDVVRLGDL